jgi:DNA polymerase-1
MAKVLLVDGNNLFTIGFHGAKGYFHKERYVGGIFHFINTLRLFLEANNYDRIVVFWDGEDSTKARKELFPQYKENRKNVLLPYQEESFAFQRMRVMQYLEEIFVRQCSAKENEADDLIAYYCQLATNDNITIFSGDRDYAQLIDEKVSLYLPDNKTLVKNGDAINFKGIQVHHKNVLLYKTIVGDSSDNIGGIAGIGVKTLKSLIPDLDKKVYSFDDLFDLAKETNNKKILNAKNKSGILSEEFYNIVPRIIDLKNPLINEEGKLIVEEIYFEKMNPEDRGYKNLMKLMMEDGLFKFLPKKDDGWVYFFTPFMKLIRKEKNYGRKEIN